MDFFVNFVLDFLLYFENLLFFLFFLDGSLSFFLPLKSFKFPSLFVLVVLFEDGIRIEDLLLLSHAG